MGNCCFDLKIRDDLLKWKCLDAFKLFYGFLFYVVMGKGKRRMRTLLLSAPSFVGFDGGTGAQYQARGEIRSFWYPTWLAYQDGMLPESRPLDAPPADVAALSAAIGEALLNCAMKRGWQVDMAEFSHWVNLVMSVVQNPYIFISVIFLVIYLFLYLIALSWADLSFVLPFIAVSYIFGAILARVFLKEDIICLRWAGTIVIIIAITLIALDGRHRTGQPRPEAQGGGNAFSKSVKR